MQEISFGKLIAPTSENTICNLGNYFLKPLIFIQNYIKTSQKNKSFNSGFPLSKIDHGSFKLLRPCTKPLSPIYNRTTPKMIIHQFDICNSISHPAKLDLWIDSFLFFFIFFFFVVFFRCFSQPLQPKSTYEDTNIMTNKSGINHQS